jgi:2-furoyl-CoA dehydrogenase 2Fe-2S iron sulfur subunit
MPRVNAETSLPIRFTLDGEEVSVSVTPRTLLSDALRHQLGVNAVHVGCEQGICGACTLTIDDAPARACLTLAIQVEGARLRTARSLSPGGKPGPLAAAFARHFALQCGFCTPGLLVALDAWLRRRPEASEAELRAVIGGHLCRCTGYQPILAAALAARAAYRASGGGGEGGGGEGGGEKGNKENDA